jgi:prepilin-type processing-associated H-X9-DG protein
LTSAGEIHRSGGTRAAQALALAVWVVAALAGLLTLAPPAPADDPARDEVSVERALAHVDALATAPRPVGATAHLRARRYLAERLTELGLEVDVQRAVVFRPGGGGLAEGAVVHNVMGRRPGTAPGGALLLAAHYDTVAGSPGAADNAAAVAALLEAARALVAGPPAPHDVIFLFTDGEEIGLLGARAFVEEHPWARRVEAALNFDARGTRGASIMFETGPGSAWLVERLAEVAPRPLASSYSETVYRLLGNQTDFAVFRDAGWRGLNFAFIDGHVAYHTQRDDPRRLDPRSLGHHGTQALALARELGDALPSSAPGGEAVYFNLPGWGLVVYSQALALPFALSLAAFLVVSLVLLRRRGVRPRGALGAAVGVVATMVAAAVAGVLAHLLMGFFTEPDSRLGQTLVTGSVIAFAAAGAALVGGLLGRHRAAAETLAGGALVAALLAVTTALAMPGASFLVTWPLAGLLGGVLWLSRRGRGGPMAAVDTLAVALAGMPAVVLWAPALALLAKAFGAQGAVLLAMVAAVPLALLAANATALTPARPATWLGRAAVPGAMAALGVALAVAAAVGGERLRANSLLYVLDTERVEAHWVTFDGRADSWSEQYLTAEARLRTFTDVFEGPPRELLAAGAPRLTLAPPTAAMVGEMASPDGSRRLRLTVRSPRGAAVMRIAFRASAGIGEIAVEGRPLPGGEVSAGAGARSVVLHGVGESPLPVEIELLGPGPLQVTLMDVAYGLPTVPGRSFRARGPGLIPSPYAPTDVSLVRSSLVF